MTWAAVLAFGRKNWMPIVIAVGALALILFIFTAGQRHEQAKEDQRTIKVERQVGDANTNASDARVDDAVRTEQQRKELDAATQALGDPDRERALRGCVILRQQGRDTSGIPACGGPAR